MGTPIMGFDFLVEIDGNPVQCQSVNGLEVEMEQTGYRSGESNELNTVNVGGMQKFSGTLTLENAIIEESAEEITDLFNEALEEKNYYDEDSKFDISIELLNTEGDPAMTWLLEGCSPKKYKFNGLNAMENKIATYSLEFTYNRFTMEVG